MERPTNLVESWLQATTANGERHADALAQLNADLGTRHRLNRLYEWRAGTYPVPAPVQLYMLRATWSTPSVPRAALCLGMLALSPTGCCHGFFHPQG